MATPFPAFLSPRPTAGLTLKVSLYLRTAISQACLPSYREPQSLSLYHFCDFPSIPRISDFPTIFPDFSMKALSFHDYTVIYYAPSSDVYFILFAPQASRFSQSHQSEGVSKSMSSRVFPAISCLCAVQPITALDASACY